MVNGLGFAFEHEVAAALSTRPHLRFIRDDVLGIARRLRAEVDPTLFLVYNVLAGRFEVHSLDHKPDTYAWTIPFKQLDERTLKRAHKNNIRVRGGPAIFREIDEHNERLERSLERQRRNDLNAIAKETRRLFSELPTAM